MTVATTTSRNQYAGAGSAGPFTYSFRILAAADLLVVKRVNATLVETVLVLNTHYTVTGVGNATGTITLSAPLAVGETLSIRRRRVLTQQRTVRNFGAYFPSTHEDAWDDMMLVMQGMQDQLDRSFGVSESYDPSALTLRLKPEAGKALVWQSAIALGNSPLDTLGDVALPGEGRTTDTLTEYLLNNRVVNVKDYGVTLDGVTDDRAAFLVACSAAASRRDAGEDVTLLIPDGKALAIGSGVVIPWGIHVRQAAPFLYTGSAHETAIELGDTASNEITIRKRIELKVSRSTVSDWKTGGDAGNASIGVKLINLNTCTGYVYAEGFSINVQCVSDGQGFMYNELMVKSRNARIALDIITQGGGSANENSFPKLKADCTTSIATGQARYGVRIHSPVQGYYANNNHFYEPNFELIVDGAEAVPFLIEHGTNITVRNARDEANSATFARVSNASSTFEATLGYGEGLLDDQSSSPNSFIRHLSAGRQNEIASTAFVSGPVHKLANFADGATSVGVPTVHIGAFGDGAVYRFLSGFTPNYRYLEVSGRGIGRFFDATRAKSFVVSRDVETGFGGRVYVIPYDAAGAIIATAGSVKGRLGQGFTFDGASFGGAWGTGADSEGDVYFQVTSAVKFVRILLTSGTAALRIRGFSVRTPGVDGSASWCGDPLLDQHGCNLVGSAIPTAGTWAAGQIVYDETPSAGGFVGWICTTSGTLGTLNSGSTTGGITNGTKTLTVNSATGLAIGVYITIAGVTGVKRVTNVVGTTITIDTNADATVAGAAVGYSAAVLKTWGAVSA